MTSGAADDTAPTSGPPPGRRWPSGTGRFNVSQGAVATAQGIGAAFSAGLAGLVIVWAGYGAAFLTLAGIASAGFALYLFGMPETAGSRDGPS